jgi:hypothetical protein
VCMYVCVCIYVYMYIYILVFPSNYTILYYTTVRLRLRQQHRLRERRSGHEDCQQPRIPRQQACTSGMCMSVLYAI